MVKRYELSDAQWTRICELLPGKKSDPGRTGRDNRLFVNGCLWVLRSGAHWHDLPERYGKWKTLHKRFTRWAKAGVWDRVFKVLTADRKNEYLMLDSTLVRAHQQAATGKGGTKIRRPPAFQPCILLYALSSSRRDLSMAGLDPATQPRRVGAAKKYHWLADARLLGGRLGGRPWRRVNTMCLHGSIRGSPTPSPSSGSRRPCRGSLRW